MRDTRPPFVIFTGRLRPWIIVGRPRWGGTGLTGATSAVESLLTAVAQALASLDGMQARLVRSSAHLTEGVASTSAMSSEIARAGASQGDLVRELQTTAEQLRVVAAALEPALTRLTSALEEARSAPKPRWAE